MIRFPVFIFSLFLLPYTSIANPRDPGPIESILFAAKNKEGKPEGPRIRTDAFIVLKDGEKLYEHFENGYSLEKRHLTWSIAKTIGGILVAHAVDEGLIRLEDPAKNWIQIPTEATVLDLLRMSSGIAFSEEYSGIPVNSDVARMLYTDGPKIGFAKYVSSLPARGNTLPGQHFYYSSGDSVLLMETLKAAFHRAGRAAEYEHYPWKKFFDPLEMGSAVFEQDSHGTFAASSYMYFSAGDFLRLGELLIQRGKWNGKTIIPKWYFELMNTLSPGVKNPLPGNSPNRAYSVQMTINQPIPFRNLPSEFPDLPSDSMVLFGHQGQILVASPSEKLIALRLATDQGGAFSPHRQSLFQALNTFLKNGNAPSSSKPPQPETTANEDSTVQPTRITDYLRAPQLLRASYAKELCSCLFVLDRSLELCKKDLKQFLPFLPFASIDQDSKRVRVSLIGFDATHAQLRSERLGCYLVD